VITWSDEQLSRLFWHHNSRLIFTSIAAVLVGAAGIVLLVRGLYDYAAGAALVQLANVALLVWHRAHTSLLTRLRFPSSDTKETA
jgi:hypothetical protein